MIGSAPDGRVASSRCLASVSNDREAPEVLWRPSNYNFRVVVGTSAYLFNALTGALLRLSKEEDASVANILQKSKTSSYSELRDLVGRRSLAALRRGGFLIRSDFDEVDYLRIRSQIKRFSGDGLYLAVCPTMECNFRCVYCYEADGTRSTGKRLTMDDETIQSLVAFVALKAESVRRVGIVWYGGEPALALGTIAKITGRLRKIFEKTRAEYQGYMITNGYEVTRDKLKLLRELGIGGVQVTLDGCRTIHDRRRPHVSGAGTFDRIIENLTWLKEQLAVTIRINLDKENLESVPHLLEYLTSAGFRNSRVLVTLARVNPHEGACVSAANRCLGFAEFADHEVRLTRLAWSLGLRVHTAVSPAISACGASGINHYVIDPEGWVYNCWHEVGRRRYATGRLSKSGELRFNLPNLLRWLSIDPTVSEECSQCKFLPLCMGGCLYNHLRTEGKQCPHIKYFIADRLRLYVETLTGRLKSLRKQAKGGEA